MTKPLSPYEIQKKFPEEVVMAFNNLLEKEAFKNSITILQSDVVKEIIDIYKMRGHTITRDTIFENHWLDVEGLYREVGWIVEYDKPGYNESYKAAFKFKKPSQAIKG